MYIYSAAISAKLLTFIESLFSTNCMPFTYLYWVT